MLLSRFVLQLLFGEVHQATKGESQDEVDNQGDAQAGKSLVCHGDYIVSAEHQVADADNRNDGGFLDDGNELVAQGGQNVADSLGQHHDAHGLDIRQAD